MPTSPPGRITGRPRSPAPGQTSSRAIVSPRRVSRTIGVSAVRARLSPRASGAARRRADTTGGAMQPDSSAAPTPAAYVDTRRIGAATVTLISEGLVLVPVDSVIPAPQAAWLRARGETDAQDRVATGQT